MRLSITFTNEKIGSIKEEYNNKKTCIFIDPPYLTECNDFYDDYNYSCNIYEYLSNNNIKKFKCKMLIVLSDNWIVRLLFKKWTRISSFIRLKVFVQSIEPKSIYCFLAIAFRAICIIMLAPFRRSSCLVFL